MILPREDELLPSPCSFLLWPALALLLPPMTGSGEHQGRQRWGGGGASGEAAKRRRRGGAQGRGWGVAAKWGRGGGGLGFAPF